MFMISLFNKLLKFDFNILSQDGKIHFNDYMIVNKFFSLDSIPLETDEKLHEFLIDIFLKINSQLRINLNIFYTRSSDISKWFNLLTQKRISVNTEKFLTSNFNKIFEEEVKFHETNWQKNALKHFLSARINHKYYYIIEIENYAISEQYYFILHSEMSKLFRFYHQALARNELRARLIYVQNELGEKEKLLLNAEKSLKKKVYDLHNLVEASNEIYSILDYKQLINSALLTIIGQVGFQCAFILMYDQFQHSYNQIFQKGFKSVEIEKIKFEMEAPLVKFFLKHRTPVYLNKLETFKELEDHCKKFKELGIYLVAPIIYSEKLQGIIGTSEKLFGKNFSQIDFEIFHILVNIISISIGNACLYEEVKKLSLTDAMTNLHNYRYFEGRLKEELNRARRNRSKVSLLMLDIDHFKNYNDTLGHQAGDDALRQVGTILKSTVRDDDIVTRYGGEEFCIILPGISKRGMKILGERIRKRIEKNPFYKEEVQPSGKLTVSLGGATFPDDGKDFDDMLQRSDESLYKAKSMGRNQLRLFNEKKS